MGGQNSGGGGTSRVSWVVIVRGSGFQAEIVIEPSHTNLL